ncbi:helix-turn-helix transcriptional regulator [Puniceicoccaceae bacterium K14]|nr:helix-turn-helix transcriptional regulator [Puniceicoccaceae bacterium K14]
MTFDLFDLPIFFGCAIGLQLLAMHFRHPRKNRLSSGIFVSLLLIGIWQLFVFGMMFSGNIAAAPHLTLTGFPMEFLAGPLFYFYSEAVFRDRRSLHWLDALHLIPYLLGVFFLRDLYGLSAERKVAIFGGENDYVGPLPLFWFVLFVSILVSKAAYLALFARNVFRFEKNVRDITADSLLVDDVRRYRKFSWAFCGYVCLFAGLLVYLSVSHRYGVYADYVWYCLKSVWLFVFAFLAITNRSESVDLSPIEIEGLEVEDEAVETEPRKYVKSGLPEERQLSVRLAIESYMDKERPYLENELSLVVLAEQLKLHPNHLSQVINQEFGKSFNDYINDYRVGYAKELLRDTEKSKSANLMEIALESGFNSRPSFNRVFKKATSKTPSQFREHAMLRKREELIVSSG